MAVDDFVESEVALAVGAAAILFSPPVRALARRGAVSGLAGVLTAADLLRSGVRVFGRSVDLTRAGASHGLEDIVEQPQEADGSPRAPQRPSGARR